MSTWEPFTESARRVVVLASEEAQRLPGATTIDIRDLLLGIIADDSSRCSQIIRQQRGVGIEEARRIAEKHNLTSGSRMLPGQPMMFTQDAKRVIECAFEEARTYGHSRIEPEHLLLGILRHNDVAKSPVVFEICGNTQELRDEIDRQLMSGAPASPKEKPSLQTPQTVGLKRKGSMWAPFSKDARDVIVQAQLSASDRSEGHISTHHLLFGMLRARAGVGFEALAALGIQAEQLEAAIDRAFGKRQPVHITQDYVFTGAAKRAIEKAFSTAQSLHQTLISSGHLLIGMLDADDSVERIFAELHLSRERLRKDTLDRLEAL